MLCFWVLRGINSRFCSKTHWQMFLLVSGRHVGAHLGGHQHGGSIQISINLGKMFLLISSVRKIAVTWILARVFAYLPYFYFQILGVIDWTVLFFFIFFFYFDLFWMAWHWKPAIKILLCDTLTVLRCDRMPFFYKRLRENIPWPTGKRGDTGRFPFTKRFWKIPETSVGNVYWCFTQSSHSFPDSLHHSMYFPAKYKMVAQLLLSNEKLELDDDFFPIMGAVATHMRCDLHRNQGF